MLLNQELNLTVPEGFRELTGEERSKLNFIEDGEGCCLQDAGRHIMISVCRAHPEYRRCRQKNGEQYSKRNEVLPFPR